MERALALPMPRTVSAVRPRLPDLRRLRRFASPLVLVLLWQAGSMAGLIPPRTLAAPSTILVTAWGLLASGELERNLLVSLARVAVGGWGSA